MCVHVHMYVIVSVIYLQIPCVHTFLGLHAVLHLETFSRGANSQVSQSSAMD